MTTGEPGSGEPGSRDAGPLDLKTSVLEFVVTNFGVDLQKYPDKWERLYDLFKEAREQGMDLGLLIKTHLMGGQEITDRKVMDVLVKAKRVLDDLAATVNAAQGTTK